MAKPETGKHDPLYPAAMHLVQSEDVISTQRLQGLLKIGPARAADMLVDMQLQGLVSASNERGTRTVNKAPEFS